MKTLIAAACAAVVLCAVPASASVEHCGDRFCASAPTVRKAQEGVRRYRRATKIAVRRKNAHTTRYGRRTRGLAAHRGGRSDRAAVVSRETSGTRLPVIRGNLVCAANVNAYMAARGIRGTGSRMAKSFLGWGRNSGPVPGAVAVFNRGGPRSRSGHVAIVSGVDAYGRVLLLNPPNRRHGWREIVMNRRPIAYRAPG